MKKIALLMGMLWGFNAQADAEFWIDARTDSEYRSGHVEGAHNIPYDEIAEKIASVTSDKDAHIHLYCRSGNRSGKALKVLQNMGYTNAHNDGGISDLQHPAKLAD